MADDLTDTQLITALQAGEERAAVLLYERVQGAVLRTLARLVRGRDELLEDLAQSTFERMIRFLTANTLDARSNLRGWASTVATHVAIDHFRREGFERALFVTEDPETNASPPEASVEARAAVRRLHAALAAMDAKYAQTVLLHDVLGHELSEIAVLMGVSVSAAQSRLVRGRKDLVRRYARSQP